MKKFLQILGIFVFVILILLTLAIIGGIIFLKTFDIKKYKPQIIAAVSNNLGRAVDFKDIDLAVSLDQGIRFHLADLTIAENPDFGTDSFVAVKNVEAGFDLLAFVMSRQISVPSVVIRTPQITIIRNAAGVFNAQTIGPKSTNTPAKSSVSPVAALPAIFINSFKIENAQLTFIDKSATPELTLAISQITLDIQKFSLNNPFDILLEATVLSSEKNFILKGKAQLALAKSQANFSDMDVSLNLNQLPLEKLKTLPQLTAIALPKVFDGQLKIKIRDAEVSDKGLGKLNVDVFYNNGRIVAENFVPGISLEARSLDVGLENFSLDNGTPAKLSVKAALYQDEKNIDFNGKVLVDLKKGEVHLTDGEFATDLALWPLNKMKTELAPLKDVALPENLSGKFQTTIKDAVISTAGLQAILLDAKLQGGTILLNNAVPGTALAFDKTDIAIGNFSLGKQFTISLKTSYLSPMQNISFDGAVAFDLKTQEVSIKNGLAGFNLNGFALDQFKSSGLVPANVPFPQTFGGVFQVQINDLTASPKGLGEMKVDLKWQNGKIVLNEVAPGISVAAEQVSLKITDFSLTKPFAVDASLGYESDETNISFNGQVSLDQTTQKIALSDTTIKADLSKLPFEQIKTKVAPLKDVKLPEVLKGQLELIIKKLEASPQGLGTMLVDIALKDGEVGMKDVAPGISVAVSHIDADIKNFVLGSPFDFNVKCAYLSETQDFQTAGTLTFTPADQNIALKDVIVHADLEQISIEQLKTDIAVLKNVALPEKLKGNLNIAITNATVGPAGLSALTSAIELKDWEVKMKELAVPISGQASNFKLTESQLTSDDLAINLGKGTMAAKVSVTDYMKTQGFDLSAEIKGIDVAQVLDQSQAPVKLEGLVFANIKAKGQGADLNSITGDGNFEVKEAKLKDLNVLKMILEKVSFIPNLAENVEAKLPDNYKAKLDDKDTTINKVSGTFAIAGGNIIVDPIAVEADEFVFSGKSQASFDQNYAVDGAFKITTELSALMGQSSQELTYLYDSNNNISLPVHIVGKGSQMPTVSVLQSAADLTKNAARTEGKKELGKMLDKALGTSGNTQGESTGSQIIGGILNKILK